MVLDYSTFSLTDEPVRTATMSAIEAAEKAGIWISFDPNLRKPLWESEELAKEQIRYGLGHCNILKISDDELVWFTGEQDYEKAIQQLRVEFQIPLILLSLGKAAAAPAIPTLAYTRPFTNRVAGFVIEEKKIAFKEYPCNFSFTLEKRSAALFS